MCRAPGTDPRHLREGRLLCQALARQTVHLQRAFFDIALGIQVLVEASAGQAPIEQLHATDFDDAVLLFDFKTRGFRIENDLTHS